MNKIKEILPGLLLALGVAVPSWYLGKSFTLVGGPVFAILIGMLIVFFFKLSNDCREGIKFTSKKILQYSIILLGFQMNLFNVIRVGRQSLSLILFTVSSAFIVAIVIGKLLRIKRHTATLIGVGTAICGGSAIAATAPVIKADDEEIASAISTIFLFNIIAVLAFPAIGRMLNMTDTGFGIWAGLAINDTSSVVAAGQVWSQEALQMATIVKLTRTLMILPVTLFLGFYEARTSKTENKVNLAKILPWFIFGFLLASVITTVNLVPMAVVKFLSTAGRFMIVVAMAAIGLNTNFKQLVSNGMMPLLLGLSCWTSVALVSIMVQRMMSLW